MFPLKVVVTVFPLVALIAVCDDCGAIISGISRVRGKQVRITQSTSNIGIDQLKIDLGCNHRFQASYMFARYSSGSTDVISDSAYSCLDRHIGFRSTFKQEWSLFGLVGLQHCDGVGCISRPSLPVSRLAKGGRESDCPLGDRQNLSTEKAGPRMYSLRHVTYLETVHDSISC